MTLTTKGVEYQTSGDGVTVSFVYPHRFADTDDLRVEIIEADGSRRAVLATVTGSGSGATVTLDTPPAADEAVVIYRDTDLTQETNYTSGNFPALAHQLTADRLVMMAQERAEVEARSLRFARGAPEVKAMAPEQFLGRSIVLNQTGDAFEPGPSIPDIDAALAAEVSAAADAAAAAVSRAAADAAAAAATGAVGAAGGYATRGKAESAVIPALVQTVRVTSYDGPGIEPVEYRRSTAAEVSDLGLTGISQAWFQSADGAHWLLDVQFPRATMFGARAHRSMAELTHEGAVDSTAAITAARAYARALRRTLILDGYFMHTGDLVPEAAERIVGAGRHQCGIQVRSGNDETGIRVVNDNVTLVGFEAQAYLVEPKLPGGGTGLIGNALTFGRYFDGGGVTKPTGYYVDDLLLTRKENEAGYTSYNGIALQISGGANQGHVGLIEIAGRHSSATMSHWNGDGAAPHEAFTQSRHPRYFNIQKFILTGDQIDTIYTFSSVGSVRVESMVAEQCKKLVAVLAGDDIDDFNIGDPNVGAHLRIEQAVCNKIDSGGAPVDDAAVSITSLGTSKFQTEEGQPKKSQLPVHVSFGELTMHTDDGANIPYAIDLFEHFGSVTVEHANITGFPYALRARRSRGASHVNFDHTDGKVLVSGSDMVVTGYTDRGDPTGYDRDAADLDGSYNVRAESDGWASTAANDVTRGDTSITVPAGIPDDIVRGSDLFVTGTVMQGGEPVVETLSFIADDFSETGLTVIPLGRTLPHDMTGVTVRLPGLSRLDADFASCLGSRSGVVVEGALARIRNASAGRFSVMAKGADSFAAVDVVTPVSGQARALTETYPLYDLYCEDGATAHIRGQLGAAKVSAIGLYYSIGGAGPANSRVLIDGAHIVDPARLMAAGDQIDLEFGAYTTGDGLLLPQVTPIWTPVLERHASGAAGITTTTGRARCVIDGARVQLSFEITITAYPTPGTTEYMRIIGLPVAIAENAIGHLAIDNGSGSMSVPTTHFFLEANTAGQLRFFRQATSGTSTIKEDEIGLGNIITGEISYFWR